MKARYGFVSNSSSSSFVISKRNLTDGQIFAIKNHIEVANLFKNKEQNTDKIYKIFHKQRNWIRQVLKLNENELNFGYLDKEDEWKISDKEDSILGETEMTNFNMRSFMRVIGVFHTKINWEE